MQLLALALVLDKSPDACSAWRFWMSLLGVSWKLLSSPSEDRMVCGNWRSWLKVKLPEDPTQVSTDFKGIGICLKVNVFWLRSFKPLPVTPISGKLTNAEVRILSGRLFLCLTRHFICMFMVVWRICAVLNQSVVKRVWCKLQ